MVEVTWMTDGSGVETAHRNAPDLSQKQSFLGVLRWNRAEDKWYATFGGEYPGTDGELLGPYDSSHRARTALLGKILKGVE